MSRTSVFPRLSHRVTHPLAVMLLAASALLPLAAHAQTKLGIANANISASGSDGNLPVNANDGSLATRWSADASTGTQWLQYNLGACYSVNYANLAWYSGDSRKYSLKLRISNDGNSWTDVFSGTNSGTTAQLKPYTFGNKSARYVRLEGTGNTVNSWVSLSEMEIWINGAGSCSSLNPSVPPGSNFDLSIWQLQLPSGTTDNPDQKSPAQLEAGFTNQYFYTDTGDGSMTFWCPENGVHTMNSNYARSELREMNADGSAANWGLSGTHTLNNTLKVVKTDGTVVIGQIHIGSAIQSGLTASTKPLLELYYHSNGDITVGVENDPTGGQTVSPVIANIPLGQQFSYQIKESNNTLTVTINGAATSYAVPSGFVGYGEYFKAGDYFQTAGSSATIGAQVQVYALSVSHN